MSVKIIISLDRMLEDLNFLLNQPEHVWEVLSAEFVDLFNQGAPPPQTLVKVLWKYWTFKLREDRKPFTGSNEQCNVALLLYARVYGLPVKSYPQQQRYLEQNLELYKPLVSKRTWGTRATLSPNILATLNSPILQVFSLKRDDVPERIIIVGQGLAKYRSKVLNDALSTALRVQASANDFFNDGLIIINRSQDESEDLPANIALPVLGSDAPLANASTSEAAMRELIRQLRGIADNTGFVQIHELDISKDDDYRSFYRKQVKSVKCSQSPVLLAPDDVAEGQEELITCQPIFDLENRGKTKKKNRLSTFDLSLNNELLETEDYKNLIKVYKEEIIHGIIYDARLRLDFYQSRSKSITEEKNQWDNSSEDERKQRWDATIEVNSTFDNEVGLAIWLRSPERIPTEEYFADNVPKLLRNYKAWSERTQRLIDDLQQSNQRLDAPFQRLITTRCFDGALRNCSLDQENLRIQKVFNVWAGPIRDLLCFEWRRKLNAINAEDKELFNAHTTFNVVFHCSDDSKRKVSKLHLVPYSLIDLKRSVVLLDLEKRFSIVKDASDDVTNQPHQELSGDLRSELQQLLSQESNSDIHLKEAIERLVKRLNTNPQKACEEILSLLKLKITSEDLEEAQKINKISENFLDTASSFPRLLNRAETAMRHFAILTARTSLDEALDLVGPLLEKFEDPQYNRNLAYLEPIDAQELRCRIHLLTAIAECFNNARPDYNFKEQLLDSFRARMIGKEKSIANALINAESADRGYTEKWVEYLEQWDLGAAYSKLLKGLPTDRDLSSVEQYCSMLVFDAMQMIQLAEGLRKATAELSHIQETRETALIKLGPALEKALLPYSSNGISRDVEALLDIFTGYKTPFSREN